MEGGKIPASRKFQLRVHVTYIKLIDLCQLCFQSTLFEIQLFLFLFITIKINDRRKSKGPIELRGFQVNAFRNISRFLNTASVV
jgi:hypothetical protein